MIIKLFKFNKKTNSLSIPDSVSGIDFECFITEDTSIVNPVLKMQFGKNLDAVKYNYAYIPDFERYYFINDVVSEKGFWFLSCIEDVLASWRNGILDSTQYVTRSESESDLTLIDTLYPAKTETLQKNTAINMYEVNTYKEGIYILTVINRSGDTTYTGVTMYALMYFHFQELMSFLLSSDNASFWGFSDINDLLKAQFNPLQYIISLKWYPIPLTSLKLDNAEKIKYGFWTLDIMGGVVTETSYYQRITSAVIPKHPQTEIKTKNILKRSENEWYGGNYFLNDAQMKYNARIIYSYLSNIGWTINAIAAILGNMQSESSINPFIWEGLKQDNLSGGYGLVQWTPATKYINWAGEDWRNANKELDRIQYEAVMNMQWFSNPQAPTPDPPITFAEFTKSTEDVETLANYFLWYYEHPAVTIQPQRSQQAKRWFDYFGGVAPDPPDPPKPHPKYDNLSYLNCEPFSKYQLYLMPFGIFPLDPLLFKNDSIIQISLKVDFLTGIGVLDIYTDDKHTLAHAQCGFGIDIPLSQITVNKLGIFQGIAEIATAPLQLLNFNPIAGVSNALGQIGSGVGTAFNAMLPQVSVRNNIGNTVLLKDGGHLEAEFVYLVEKDKERGEPLCQNKKLADLSGYCECSHVHIEIPCTLQENNEIVALLEGGVFIE